MVENTVITSVQNYLAHLQADGIPVHFGVIFGSQVTGQTHTWSDIDLLVVSPQFDNIRNRKDLSLLWRLAAKTDARIEPIACGERQWVEDDSSAIIEIARRYGQIVHPA